MHAFKCIGERMTDSIRILWKVYFDYIAEERNDIHVRISLISFSMSALKSTVSANSLHVSVCTLTKDEGHFLAESLHLVTWYISLE